MFWMQTDFTVCEMDAILQKTPVSFDASVWEFYAPLLAGARLVMARPGGHQDPAYLVKTILEQHITILQLVPSLLQILVEESHFETCPSLRHVFCGGEALAVDLADRFAARLATASLHNLYGPTEACIDSTFWTCRRGGPQRVIPIGRPVANMQAYVLDDCLCPVPIGVPGKLYIGGVGLARSYLNRPEMTAENFIPNPFSGEPGTRLYRTGDLARYLPDSNLEFLGRLDSQVKLRGFRIELGEIEVVLRQHPAVREAVVVVREDEPGDTRLVAYLVASREDEPASGAVRNFLVGQLPGYMIPSAIVWLKALPLTPSGKLDRKALPILDRAQLGAGEAFVPPRSPLEQTLAGIWAEVLRVERIGVHDNFFELGGHSLLAMQVISRVRTAFQVDLPLPSFFAAPTVAGLADSIETILWMAPSQCAHAQVTSGEGEEGEL
jgi:acyl-coenzyme A synthetase/AMP-(fatty) acid ligase/acyl carrier protein